MLRIPLSKKRLRALAPEDMQNMHIGEKHWVTSFDSIPDSAPHKKIIREYLDDIVERVRLGRGLIITGSYGSGKTGTGVLILKEVRARGGSGLMVTASEIPSSIIEKTPYDEDYTMHERMLGVDMLLIDDLNREHVKEWGRSAIEALIRHRYDNNRSLIITTNASAGDLKDQYEAAMLALSENCQLVTASGVNFRVKRAGG